MAATSKRPSWTAADQAIMREHYPVMPKKELLALLPNRNWQGVRMQAHRMNLPRQATN